MDERASLPPDYTSTPARPVKKVFNLPDNFEDMSPILPLPSHTRPKSLLPVPKISAVKKRSAYIHTSGTNTANGNIPNNRQITGSTSNGPALTKSSAKLIKPVSKPTKPSPKSLKKVPEPSTLKIDTAPAKPSPKSLKQVIEPSSFKTNSAPAKASPKLLKKVLEPSSLITDTAPTKKSLKKVPEPSTLKTDTDPAKPSPKLSKEALETSSLITDPAPAKSPLKSMEKAPETPLESLEKVPEPSSLIMDSSSAKQPSKPVKKALPEATCSASSNSVDLKDNHEEPCMDILKNPDTDYAPPFWDLPKKKKSLSLKKKSSIPLKVNNLHEEINLNAVPEEPDEENEDLSPIYIPDPPQNKRKTYVVKMNPTSIIDEDLNKIDKDNTADTRVSKRGRILNKNKTKVSLNKNRKPTNFYETPLENLSGPITVLAEVHKTPEAIGSPIIMCDNSNENFKFEEFSNNQELILKDNPVPNNDGLPSTKPFVSINNESPKELAPLRKRGRTRKTTDSSKIESVIEAKAKKTEKRKPLEEINVTTSESPNKNLVDGPQNIDKKVKVDSTDKSISKVGIFVEKLNDVKKKNVIIKNLESDCDQFSTTEVVKAIKKRPSKVKPEKVQPTETSNTDLVAETPNKDTKRKTTNKKVETLKSDCGKFSNTEVIKPTTKRQSKIKSDKVEPTETYTTDLVKEKPKKATKRKAINEELETSNCEGPANTEVVKIPKKIKKKLKPNKVETGLELNDPTNTDIVIENPKKVTKKKTVKTPKKATQSKQVYEELDNLESNNEDLSNTKVGVLSRKRKTISKPGMVLKKSTVDKVDQKQDSAAADTGNHELDMSLNSDQLAHFSKKKTVSGRKTVAKKTKIVEAHCEENVNNGEKKPEKGRNTTTKPEEVLNSTMKATKQKTESSKDFEGVVKKPKMSLAEDDSPATSGKSTVNSRRSKSRNPEEVLINVNSRRSKSRDPEEVLIDGRLLNFGNGSVDVRFPWPGVRQENHLWIKGFVGSGVLTLESGASIPSKKTYTCYTLIKGEVKVRMYDRTKIYKMEDAIKTFFIPRGASFCIKNERSEPAELTFCKFN